MMQMRRSDREIRDPDRMFEILQSCDCCRLGLLDGTEVYIVPLNFGCSRSGDRFTLYFHGAKEGRKARLLAESATVSFELDTGHALLTGALPCKFSCRYQSVFGKGRITQLEVPEEKEAALRHILRHYSPDRDWTFPPAAVDSVLVWRLDVTEWSCKERR